MSFARLLFKKAGEGDVRTRIAIGLSVSIFLLGGAATARMTPMGEIQGAITNAFQLLKQQDVRSQRERKKLAGELLKVIDPVFDFHQMAKSALEQRWKDLTPAQQRAFIPLFKRLVINKYLDKFASHDARKVVFTRQTSGDGLAEVDTEVTGGKANQVSVNYLLKRADAAWKIYDVSIDGVSIINNYRAQVDHAIYRSPSQELLNRINENFDIG
jgi:phospholipid transport system substrate-binding protein